LAYFVSNEQMGRKKMQTVNIDLLRASTPFYPDGRPKDPHAHHRPVILAARHSGRLQGWHAFLGKALRFVRLSGFRSKAALGKDCEV
jgi:hypothetical protein